MEKRIQKSNCQNKKGTEDRNITSLKHEKKEIITKENIN